MASSVRGCNSNNQTCGGNNAIVCAQDRSAQPADPFRAMSFFMDFSQY
jgi:hypothetical protein